MEPTAEPTTARRRGPGLALITAVGAALLKLKWLIGLLKLGKFAGTFVSMLVTIAVYAMLFGWPFAVGFVALLFVHEMGHAAVIRWRGIAAGAPVFVPLVGAMITLRQHPPDARTEAEVGIGGPLAGALAATACWLIYLGTGSQIWCALGYVGFFLNLFNLIPLTPLDGGRIAGAISRWLWIPGILVMAVMLWVRFSPVLLLVTIMAGVQLWHEFRRGADEAARYYEVPVRTRVTIGILYFGLATYLGYASIVSHDVLMRLR